MSARNCLVIAHRGASTYAPENTYAAFDLALDRLRRMIGERRFALGVQLIAAHRDPILIAEGYSDLAEAAIVVMTEAVTREFETAHGRIAGGEFVVAERLRAGGAGIPAFFTRTGYGTVVAEGKETRQFGEHWYVMETALMADVSLVKAWKADKAGNLVFRKTARNFNPACAMAGKVCVAEVEEVVEIGAIDPDQVHLPGIYVDRIVHNPTPEKRIEQRTVRGAN